MKSIRAEPHPAGAGPSTIARRQALKFVSVGGDSNGDSRSARRMLIDAYAPVVRSGVPALTMDTRSAELSKRAANAMLATRIGFVNEIAAIAGAAGADIEKVCEGIGSDRRIGPAFLRAGLGYGGSCFPKDVVALRETARRHNLRADVLLRNRTRERPPALLGLSRAAARRRLTREAPRPACGGVRSGIQARDRRRALRTEPGTRRLPPERRRARVALGPAAMPNARRAIAAHRRLVCADSAAAALAGADVLVLATERPEFVDFDPAAAARELRLRTVYDGRNALDAAHWGSAGLHVRQIGRQPAFARVAPMPFIATVVAHSAPPVAAPDALQLSIA